MLVSYKSIINVLYTYFITYLPILPSILSFQAFQSMYIHILHKSVHFPLNITAYIALTEVQYLFTFFFWGKIQIQKMHKSYMYIEFLTNAYTYISLLR